MATINLDTAARLDIVCRKGDSFDLKIDFGVAIDSNADNWKMEIAADDRSTAELTISDDYTASGGDYSGFTVESNADGLANSQLRVRISSTDMATLDGGMYVYDIQRDSNNSGTGDGGGIVQTYVYGTLLVNEDITTPN